MKLESLSVKNIRSMKNLELDFPESVMLFFGDIGSGKSSVLKAIEFALFGTMGELPGSSLLRRGEKKGSVELEFTLEDKNYIVHRELQKVMRKEKETITQPQGWLIEDGTKTSYTTTDLRIKILELLNYSVSNYKAANKKCIDLYRYTVYTPQEEIKKILLTDPKERFGILKDVLEIEKYENIIHNLENIRKQINRDLKVLEITLKEIGSPEDDISELNECIAILTESITSMQIELTKLKKQSEKEKTEQSKLQEELNKFSTDISTIKSNQNTIAEDRKTTKSNEETIQKLISQISDKKGEIDSLTPLELKTDLKEEELEAMIKEDRNKLNTTRDEITREKETIEKVDKLLEEGECSLCGQKVHEKDRFDKELAAAQKKLQKLEGLFNKKENEISELEILLKNVREYAVYIQKKSGLEELVKEKEGRKTDLEKTNNALLKKIDQLTGKNQKILKSFHLNSLDKVHEHEEGLKSKIELQKGKIESIQGEITEFVKKISSEETNLTNAQIGLQDLNKRVKRKDKLQHKHERMKSINEWVSDQLPVLIKDIEHAILESTASEFNRYFKEWFRALVENENIDIEINPEDFQPIVLMNEYESPFGDLSGGEQSALALAYRLALNKVINLKFHDVKTKELLILDEPTDGFSEQQVIKMQEVFEKLNMTQMIIISHERTLDSFVTDIFNFSKRNHQTKVLREESKDLV